MPKLDEHMSRNRSHEFIPSKKERPFCGARCRDGHACRAKAAINPHTGRLSKRCRMHGGHSSGARTPEGKVRALLALAKGREMRRLRREGLLPSSAPAATTSNQPVHDLGATEVGTP